MAFIREVRGIVVMIRSLSAKLGRQFTHWSIRKLADYLNNNTVRQDVRGEAK